MRGCPPFTHVACNALHTLGVAGTQKGRLLLFDADTAELLPAKRGLRHIYAVLRDRAIRRLAQEERVLHPLDRLPCGELCQRA